MRHPFQTLELCGQRLNPTDPESPVCVLIKDTHGNRAHEAPGPNGAIIKWRSPRGRNPFRDDEVTK
jgi:hypothetical protein